MAYAHSRNGRGEYHDLVDHLRGVARLTAEFAAAFGSADLGHFLGLWHDVGKFDPKWQEYLLASEAGRTARGHGPDHKGAGALLALKHLGALAHVVQGHHGGLRNQEDLRGWLQERQRDQAVSQALALARERIPDLEPAGELPLPEGIRGDALAAELYLRMLFSTLVDADSLDTEQHGQQQRAELRGSDVSLEELWQRFERDQARLLAMPESPVNLVRREVYEHCLTAADEPPGVFRLTVPTGGGKTRSALAFALRHAIRHGLRRVIVAVPFLTITDQTAATYRSIFGAEGDDRPVVLEHHSMADRTDADEDEEDFRLEKVWARLAAENWDAPIVITTTVQLLESTFARSRSATRKLHRMARSVIIIDEAQTFPPHLLQPILHGLQQLCAQYGSTVIISTATQPAFGAIPSFASVQAREIVPDPGRYFERLRRVTYNWRTEPALPWSEVAQVMREAPQALAVVNTKKDALALLDALDDSHALHLSTLLCAAHRREVIERVKAHLEAGEPCRLVATQVVEAGVDLDFPLVLRALGPLDSIIQAAGRCNREGRLERGEVVVFEPQDGGMPPGAYRVGAAETRTLRRSAQLDGVDLDPDDPAIADRYFRRLFATVNTDRDDIQHLRSRFDYPEVSRRFRMIEDTEGVVITSYGSDEERARVRNWLEQLRQGSPDARLLLRRLQPYLVSVYHGPLAKYQRAGFVSQVRPGLWEWHGRYDRTRGLVAEDPDVASFVV